jgi:serine/threonine protein kinase
MTWGSVSEGARNLLQRLLCVDPSHRYDAHQALDHPWLKTHATGSYVRMPELGSPSSYKQ